MEGMAASRKGIKDFAKSNMQMIRAELSLGEWERRGLDGLDVSQEESSGSTGQNMTKLLGRVR